MHTFPEKLDIIGVAHGFRSYAERCKGIAAIELSKPGGFARMKQYGKNRKPFKVFRFPVQRFVYLKPSNMWQCFVGI